MVVNAKTADGSVSFEKAFSSFVGFIGENPGVTLRRTKGQMHASSLHVAPAARLGFDLALDRASSSLARELAADDLCTSEASGLDRESLVRALDSIVSATGLSRVALPSRLDSFVKDETAFEFQVLRRIVRQGVMEGVSSSELFASAKESLREERALMKSAMGEAALAYQTVAMLEPSRAYAVRSLDGLVATAAETDELVMGMQSPSPECRVPEAVFDGARGPFAYKFEVASELDYYRSKIKRRRDSTAAGNTTDVLAHRSLLLFKLPASKAVPLITERHKDLYHAPDLIVERLDEARLSADAFFYKLVERTTELEPQIGTAVVAPRCEALKRRSEELASNQAPPIAFLTLGIRESAALAARMLYDAELFESVARNPVPAI